jgi:hypothetical protein
MRPTARPRPRRGASRHDERGGPHRQPRQRGAQHRPAHACRQGRGCPQRAAPRPEPAGAGRPGARRRNPGAGTADRRGGRRRDAPCRRGPHRRSAGRRAAGAPRPRPGDGRGFRRRRPDRAADAARPLRAAGAVAAQVCDPGIRFTGAHAGAGGAPRCLGGRRRRRRPREILAEQSRLVGRNGKPQAGRPQSSKLKSAAADCSARRRTPPR